MSAVQQKVEGDVGGIVEAESDAHHDGDHGHDVQSGAGGREGPDNADIDGQNAKSDGKGGLNRGEKRIRKRQVERVQGWTKLGF